MAQEEELQALQDIFGQDILKCERNPADNATIVHIRVRHDAVLQLLLPHSYPTSDPPLFELGVPWGALPDAAEVASQFERAFEPGMPVIFTWTELWRDHLNLHHPIVEEAAPDVGPEDEEDVVEAAAYDDDAEEGEPTTAPVPSAPSHLKIFHDEPFSDRKSTFQAHVATVNSTADVKLMQSELLQNGKVARATHNILAYRIKLSNGAVAQDCEDDGEYGAGSRMLHLLQILDVTNVAVVVTRWYGGIHLGADRFKHINNATRNALKNFGYIAA